MDFKTMIVQRIIDMSGNIIANQLSQPDWDARRANIEKYYKDLEPIKKDLPDAPLIEEPHEYREKEKTRTDEIVNQICTSDLSPKEMLMCQECVRMALTGSSTDIIQKYFEPSL